MNKMKSRRNDILNSDPNLKENPFRVPVGYFEGLSSRIMNRVEGEKSIAEPERRIGLISGYRLAIAASVIGLAALSFALLRVVINNESDTDDYIDISLLDEMDHLPEDAYLVELFTTESEEYSEEQKWEDNAIEYLASNDADLELIVEQY